MASGKRWDVQVRFAVPLCGASLSPLRPCLPHYHAPDGSFPDAVLQGLQRAVVATFVFPVSGPSEAPPSIDLRMPSELQAVMGES